MEYYLQVLIGGLALIAVTVPLSDNYKQIKVKNIFFAILMMFVFAFILLNIVSCTISVNSPIAMLSLLMYSASSPTFCLLVIYMIFFFQSLPHSSFLNQFYLNLI